VAKDFQTPKEARTTFLEKSECTKKNEKKNTAQKYKKSRLQHVVRLRL